MKVAFFGTSNRSEPILEILKENFDLELCVTKSNRIVGRSQEEKETVVKEWAKRNEIDVFEIEKMKAAEESLIKELVSRNIELIIVADFGFLVTKPILDNFKDNIINLHFSLLPKYRGANPVQAAIINGDQETGITFLLMTQGLDEGDILAQVTYLLKGTENSGKLYEELFSIAAQELPNVISKYKKGNLTPKEQKHDEAVYYYSPSHPKSTYIYKEDAKIDWGESPEIIERKIRAFAPWPIAWTNLEDLEKAGICNLKPSVNKKLTLKIYGAKINEEKVIPIEVQLEGKKITDWKSFNNGYCLK